MITKFLLSIILIANLLATRLLVPEEYDTIQAGIDAATTGDTVLVNDGWYYENIEIDRSIVLASYAIFDDLSDWLTNEDDIYFGQWITTNTHIQNTHIVGSNPNNPERASCILIISEDECIEPEIIGFTIRDGGGTEVTRVNSDEDEYSLRLGGGILSGVSNPLIHYNQFKDNGSGEVFSGGGIYATTEPEDWGFDATLFSFPRCEIDEIQISNNLYNGNDALYGNSFSNTYYEGQIDMSGSIFDVFDCNDQDVSLVWVDTEPLAEVDFQNGAGNLCAFTFPNVYVNPNIEQECLDEGCGIQSNPFKTISRAMELINPTDPNPVTINLASGTYSPDTGETYPLIITENINLSGESEESVVLDAMASSGSIPPGCGTLVNLVLDNETNEILSLGGDEFENLSIYDNDDGENITDGCALPQNSVFLADNGDILYSSSTRFWEFGVTIGGATILDIIGVDANSFIALEISNNGNSFFAILDPSDYYNSHPISNYNYNLILNFHLDLR